MNPQQSGHPHHRLSWFEIAILILSLYVVSAIAVDTLFSLPKEVSKILDITDGLICGVFFFDFFIRLRRAPDKAAFWKWGWIDLLASIPNVDFLRYGRLVRVLRVFRLLRAVRSTHKIVAIVFENKIRSAFGSVLLITFLLITSSTVAILVCERDPDANIKTAGDALWWSVTTVTTVGYGDKYPTSFEGRVVAMLLMFGGVGLFGTFSGLLASYFLGITGGGNAQVSDLSKQIDVLTQKLDALLQEKQKS